MPYVNIKITKEGASPEQKATLIKGVAALYEAGIIIDNLYLNLPLKDRCDDEWWGCKWSDLDTLSQGKGTSLHHPCSGDKWNLPYTPIQKYLAKMVKKRYKQELISARSCNFFCPDN